MPSTPLINEVNAQFVKEAVGEGDTERPPAVSEGGSSGGSSGGSGLGTEVGVPGTAALSPEPPSGIVAQNTRQPTMLHAGAPPVPAELALTRRCTACGTLYPSDFLVCPRDASPLVDEAKAEGGDPLLGALLGESYQVVRVIGEGGMGRVYEARHLRLKERRFAAKVLHGDLAKNPEIVARFMREAESASSLSHPNVVDVFDVHHLPDGTPYLVGEFLDGEELADLVTRQGALEPRVVASIGRQVCRALAAAHARGIVHRDLKPENVFVLRPSLPVHPPGAALAAAEPVPVTIKVLDFGISKSGDSERSHLTRTGFIMGTPSYMSPEQARGRPVDLRADVYSTGATLYYALTGKRPFDADDPTTTISMVLTQDPPRPRDIDPRIPEALELVVQRAMAKDPRERYATMHDLERALAAFEESASGRGAMVVHGASAGSLAPATPAADSNAADRALDLAKSLFGSPSASGAQSTSLARVARPSIVVSSVVLGLWLVGGTTAALAGLVRVLHDGEVTLTESVLLVVGCLFAAATPAALYVLHVRKVVWPNSVRALALAADLKRTATAALVTYGALSIASRIGLTVLWRSSHALASGVWDIALFALSILAAFTLGGAGPLVRTLRRRR